MSRWYASADGWPGVDISVIQNLSFEYFDNTWQQGCNTVTLYLSRTDSELERTRLRWCLMQLRSSESFIPKFFYKTYIVSEFQYVLFALDNGVSVSQIYFRHFNSPNSKIITCIQICFSLLNNLWNIKLWLQGSSKHSWSITDHRSEKETWAWFCYIWINLPQPWSAVLLSCSSSSHASELHRCLEVEFDRHWSHTDRTSFRQIWRSSGCFLKCLAVFRLLHSPFCFSNWKVNVGICCS